MRLSDVARALVGYEPLRELFSELEGHTTWESVAIEARPLLIAALWHAGKGRESRNRAGGPQPQPPPRNTDICGEGVGKILVVANSYDRALQWQARLRLAGVPEEQTRLLPSGLSVLFEDAAPETVALSDRIGALKFLIGDEPGIVIATPQAALERTLPADVLAGAFVTIKKGGGTTQDALIEKLARLGYEKNEPVRLPGTFSRTPA